MNYHADFEEDKFYHIINHAVGSENLFMPPPFGIPTRTA